jgi:hypothetical protein
LITKQVPASAVVETSSLARRSRPWDRPAICPGLVVEGAAVVATSLTTSPTLAELELTGRLTVVDGDITKGDVRDRLLSAAERVDVLVNDLGIARTPPQGFLEVSEADWIMTFTPWTSSPVSPSSRLHRPGSSSTSLLTDR